VRVPALAALLTGSPAFGLAESLTGAGPEIFCWRTICWATTSGGNTSQAVRRAVYFRVKRTGHNPRWREFLQDPWLEYDTVRDLA
jgi:hypothetical protein